MLTIFHDLCVFVLFSVWVTAIISRLDRYDGME